MAVAPFRPPMTPDRALQLIRRAAADTSRLGWTDHAWDKMDELGIVTRQVLAVLQDGALRKGPTRNDEYGDWVCVLRRAVAGRTVHVVAGIDETKESVTLITVY